MQPLWTKLLCLMSYLFINDNQQKVAWEQLILCKYKRVNAGQEIPSTAGQGDP